MDNAAICGQGCLPGDENAAQSKCGVSVYVTSVTIVVGRGSMYA